MILVYHHVAPPEAIPAEPEAFRAEGWEYRVSPRELAHHIETLRGRGFRLVPLSEYVSELLRLGREAPGTACLTFDDGWRDQLTFALPVLEARKAPACFFVTAEPRPADRRLTPGDWRTLLARGMEIGSHTSRHPDLTSLSGEAARREIRGSKETLERTLGRPVRYFAYPGGAFDRRVADLVREAGYEAAASVLGPGPNSPATRFWLFRDTLTGSLGARGDRLRLSPPLRRLLSLRTRRRLRRMLGA